MKTAFLILAHKNPEQILRLVKSLNHHDFDIFIHISKSGKISEKDIERINKKQNVAVIDQHIDIVLFDFSMVEAEMALIKAALDYSRNKGYEYNYMQLLSGQCYPIKSLSHIHEVYERSYPRPFIDMVSREDGGFMDHIWSRHYAMKRCLIRWYNFVDKYHLPYLAEKALHFPVWLISRLAALGHKSPEDRLAEEYNMKPYGGIQWWALPQYMAEYVLNMSQDKKLCGIFSHTYSADETFVQTIIANSPFTVFPDSTRSVRGNTLHTLEFDNGHPRLLTRNDAVMLKASNACFARKFDMSADSEILDILDSENEKPA